MGKMWWGRCRPIFIRTMTVFITTLSLLVSVIIMLESLDLWTYNVANIASLVFGVITLLIVVNARGYIKFPYAVITILFDVDVGVDADNPKKEVGILCDGREIYVKGLPRQFRIYFRGIGDYEICVIQDKKVKLFEKGENVISFYQSHVPHMTLIIGKEYVRIRKPENSNKT